MATSRARSSTPASSSSMNARIALFMAVVLGLAIGVLMSRSSGGAPTLRPDQNIATVTVQEIPATGQSPQQPQVSQVQTPVQQIAAAPSCPPAVVASGTSIVQAATPPCANLPAKARCMLGRVYCMPGWSGPRCDVQIQRAKCDGLPARRANVCFYHPVSGMAEVSVTVWRNAQSAELDVWKHSSDGNDRAGEHAKFMNGYAPLKGQNLGRIAEFGCGPYTQIKYIFETLKPSPTATDVTLLDPNLSNYLQHSKVCHYRSGQILGLPTTLISTGGEMRLFTEVFDTAIMLNVVEHVRSAFLLYENLYAAIKPGGRLVFGDRCWDDELNLMFHSPGGSTRWKQYIGPKDLTGATGSKSDEDVVGQLDGSAVTQWAQQITDKTHRDVEMHPILTSCKLVTDFLSLFHPEFEMWKKRSAVRGATDMYFIGIKKDWTKIDFSAPTGMRGTVQP